MKVSHTIRLQLNEKLQLFLQFGKVMFSVDVWSAQILHADSVPCKSRVVKFVTGKNTFIIPIVRLKASSCCWTKRKMLQKLQVKEPRRTWSVLDRKGDDTHEEPTLSKFSYSLSYHTRDPASIIYSSAVHEAWSFEANSCTNFAWKHHLVPNNYLGYGSVRA